MEAKEYTRTKKEKWWYEMGKLDGIREMVELPEFQQFLWFADNVQCISVMVGNVSDVCGCATCLAQKIEVKLEEWGIKTESESGS